MRSTSSVVLALAVTTVALVAACADASTAPTPTAHVQTRAKFSYVAPGGGGDIDVGLVTNDTMPSYCFDWTGCRELTDGEKDVIWDQVWHLINRGGDCANTGLTLASSIAKMKVGNFSPLRYEGLTSYRPLAETFIRQYGTGPNYNYDPDETVIILSGDRYMPNLWEQKWTLTHEAYHARGFFDPQRGFTSVYEGAAAYHAGMCDF